MWDNTYNSLDIARYVINKSIEIGAPATNIKLQNLLYYIQATFLAERDRPCFRDRLVNWRHGPVVETVYDEYRIYQDRKINKTQIGYRELVVDNHFQLVHRAREFDMSIIDKEDRQLIDDIVEFYSGYETWDMVEKVHRERPWKETNRGEEISSELIRVSFSHLT